MILDTDSPGTRDNCSSFYEATCTALRLGRATEESCAKGWTDFVALAGESGPLCWPFHSRSLLQALMRMARE